MATVESGPSPKFQLYVKGLLPVTFDVNETASPEHVLLLKLKLTVGSSVTITVAVPFSLVTSPALSSTETNSYIKVPIVSVLKDKSIESLLPVVVIV